MKNLTILSKKCSPFRGSQSSDVGFDCRSTLLKLVTVLVLILTVGVGQMWGAIDANSTWTPTSWASIPNGATFIIATNCDYAMYNGNGTSNPTKVSISYNSTTKKITVNTNGKSLDDIAWIYSKPSTTVTIKSFADNTKNLYTTNNAQGLKVGTTACTYSMGSGGKLLVASTYTRYVGTYNSDWRSYDSETHNNYTGNCSNQALTFYVMDESDCDDPGTALSVSAEETTLYAGVQTQLSFTGGNGSTVTYSVTSANSSYATIDGSNKFSATRAGTYTVQASQDDNEGVCGGTATVNITVRYQVKWSVNNNDSYTTGGPTTYIGTHDTKVSTLPTDPTSAMCDNSKVFVGWTTASYSHATNAPTTLFLTAASSPNVTDNVTYYAVFANRTAFTRVTSTSDLAAGKQIVVVDNQNSKVLTTAPGYATAPTESSSKITPSNNMIWTLEASSTNWKLKASGSYLGTSGTSNGTAVSLTSTNSVWNIGASSSGTNNFYLENTAKSKCCLEYYSSGSNWVVYSNNTYTSSTYFTERLYVATLTNYATTCCSQLGSINGSFLLTPLFLLRNKL